MIHRFRCMSNVGFELLNLLMCSVAHRKRSLEFAVFETQSYVKIHKRNVFAVPSL